MKLDSINSIARYCILFGMAIIQGCSSSSSPAGPTDTTSTQTCFDVKIKYSISSSTSSLCLTDENNRVNGLGVYRFARFTVPSKQLLSIKATRTSGLEPADPKLSIFKNGEFVAVLVTTERNTRTIKANLDPGNYVLQIYEGKYTSDNTKPGLPISTSASNVSGLYLKSSYPAISFAPSSSAACTPGALTVSGTVSYDLIMHTPSNGLDYPNTVTDEPVKNVVVELVCEGSVSSVVNTDMNGQYSLPAPSGMTNVFVRVKAQMLSNAIPSYDVTVVDNTRSQSLYVMDSLPFDIASSNIAGKNLHAVSGWEASTSSYLPGEDERVAGPFAILDSVLLAMNKIVEVDSSGALAFPPLKINWSINNTTAEGDTDRGQITSSHYNVDDNEIFILGAENNDTDEYDRHVIIHEWGHYFEHNFSRSDSIGGKHSGSDVLDIRVAFGEGFGNAYSAIASGDATYRDSTGLAQSSGFGFSLEHNRCLNEGWFNECSVQSILYDLSDGIDLFDQDSVSLGFKPIYDVLIGEQKNTSALTSIFSFIKALKDQNIAEQTAIDGIVFGQNINEINGIYGDSQLTDPGPVDQLPIFIQM